MSINNWSMGTAQGLEMLNELPFKFLLRLCINFLAVLILFRAVYYPIYRSRENVFTYFIFNTLIFLITYLLNKVEMSMGAAFGLFAVFTMLRYRTENISAKDMTYMFISISLGLINAINNGGWIEFIMINVLVISVTWFLESNVFIKKESTQTIAYDNIALIKPEHSAELLLDLETRIGRKIHHVSLGEMDFLRDSVMVKVFYFE
jgi:Domain of unknown function (DUF4956)